MSLRVFVAFLVAFMLPVSVAASDKSATSRLEVSKSPACGCCSKWVEHMRDNGHEVTANDVDYDSLARLKRQAGIGEDLGACHTAKVDGYVIEGHVPAEDIERLLQEKPDALGLAVPGMPVGSPGMEVGDEVEPYDVLLVRKDGSTEVFSRHGK